MTKKTEILQQFLPPASNRHNKATLAALMPASVQRPTSMAHLRPHRLLTGLTLPKGAKNARYFLLLRCFSLFSFRQRTKLALEKDPDLLKIQGSVDKQAWGTRLNFRL